MLVRFQLASGQWSTTTMFPLTASYWPRPSSGTSAAALATGEPSLFVVFHLRHLYWSQFSVPASFFRRGRQPIHLSLATTNILSPTQLSPWPQSPSVTPSFLDVLSTLLKHFLVNRWPDFVNHYHHCLPLTLPYQSMLAATLAPPLLAFFCDGHYLPHWVVYLMLCPLASPCPPRSIQPRQTITDPPRAHIHVHKHDHLT